MTFPLEIAALMLMVPITLYTELKDGKIYNWLTYPAMVLGLLLGLLGGRFSVTFWGMLLAGGVFFIPYLISGVSRGRPVIGGGDVKFAAAIGALMGWYFAIFVIYYSVFVGFVIGLAQVGWNLFKKTKSKSKVGDTQIGDADEQDVEASKSGSIWLTRIPFGTALCVGVLFAFHKLFLQG